MPDVSTTIRSKPATLQAAITSGSASEISWPASRVASERMNTDARADPSGRIHGPIAFIRMRSPSSAPPLFRRDGSIEITAMASASSWSRRSRRISSSVSDDLPAPPVPVMPSVGTLIVSTARYSASRSVANGSSPDVLPRRFSSAVISCASWRRSPPRMPSSDAGANVERSTSQRSIMSRIIPARPIRWPSSGL